MTRLSKNPAVKENTLKLDEGRRAARPLGRIPRQGLRLFHTCRRSHPEVF